LTVGMAVLNLILGVVVNVATQSREDLKQQLVDEHIVKHMSHLSQMCSELDTGSTGDLSKDEILQGYHNNDNFRATLQRMRIQEEDLEILWSIWDNEKKGSISYNSFINHCYNMKESDTEFMLAQIKHHVKTITDKVDNLGSKLSNQMDQEAQVIAQELGKVEDGEWLMKTEIHEIDQIVTGMNEKAGNLKVDIEDATAAAPTRAPLACTDNVTLTPCIAASDLAMAMEPFEGSQRWQAELNASINTLSRKIDAHMRETTLLATPKNPTTRQSSTMCCTQETQLSQDEVRVTSFPGVVPSYCILEPPFVHSQSTSSSV